MQSIDIHGFRELDADFQRILDEAPGSRRELHESIAAMLEQEISMAISNSGLNDSNSRVRRYQIKHVGSGGGYAAIRPAGSSDGAETGSNGPGAITNYLESGHKIRAPKGGKGYRPRIRVPHVNGYHFYNTAGVAAEAKAIRMAEDFANNLVGRIGGTG